MVFITSEAFAENCIYTIKQHKRRQNNCFMDKNY